MRRAWMILLLLGVANCRKDSDPPPAVEIREEARLELSLCSFNVRYEGDQDRGWRAWPNRIDRVVGAVREIGPDVLGVQEAFHGQIADLRASMPGYEFFGVGRDDGARSGEYAGIFWRRHRFAADESDRGTFWLSDTPEIPGSKSWGNEVVRVAAWVRLVDRRSGRGFYVFNTHWDHRNQSSREHSALLIGSRIDDRRHAGEPVVLMGDFNATGGNPALDYFSGRRVTLAGEPSGPWAGALIDVFQELNPEVQDRRTLHFWRGHSDGWAMVDHILVSPGAELQAAGIFRAKTRQTQPSDHFPVWARVVWPPPTPAPPVGYVEPEENSG